MDMDTYLKFRSAAYAFIKQLSGDEMRYVSPIENQPYWTHLMNVHNFLIIKGEDDYEVLLAALLHDTLEDYNVKYSDLKKQFTKRVADIVLLITKTRDWNAKTFYKKIMENKDPAGCKIKIADRIDNVLTNNCYSADIEKNKKYYAETVKYFVPMAKRVGYESDLNNMLSYFKSNETRYFNSK